MLSPCHRLVTGKLIGAKQKLSEERYSEHTEKTLGNFWIFRLLPSSSSEVVMTSIVLLGVWLSREVLNNYWCWTLEPNKIVGIFFLTSWRGDAACCGHKSQSLTVMAGIGQYQGIFITMTSKQRQGHCLGYFVFCSSLCPRPLPALIILVLHQPASSHCHLSSSWRCKLTLLLVFMFVLTTSDASNSSYSQSMALYPI